MLQLPVELRRQCLDPLNETSGNLDGAYNWALNNENTETLKALRLVNKELGSLATELLFRTAILNNTDDSAKKSVHLIQSNLNSLVRCVVINTSDEPELIGYKLGAVHWGESEMVESFRDAIAIIHGFENLEEVHVKFARECAADTEHHHLTWGTEPVETELFRTTVLESVLTAVRQAEKVKSLTIKNLQDHMDKELFESDTFIGVRERLRELHLLITSEDDYAGDGTFISFDACYQGFCHSLPNFWLKPMTEQLTHLTLYSAECPWGISPFVDFREIPPFSRLKSLSLGNLTIAHDWQIDWMLAHGPTLEELRLDRCPIVVAMDLDPDDAKANFGDTPNASAHTEEYQTIDLRWHHVFDRFRTGTPRLRHFALGSGFWREGQAFEERYELFPQLCCSRYFVLHNDGRGRWQYQHDRSEGPIINWEHKNSSVRHESHFGLSFDVQQHDDEDMEAYVLLLKTVREREERL